MGEIPSVSHLSSNGYLWSFLQNVYAPEPDPEMTVERYERSWNQNEDLGLNDMKTEGYGEETILGATAATTATTVFSSGGGEEEEVNANEKTALLGSPKIAITEDNKVIKSLIKFIF